MCMVTLSPGLRAHPGMGWQKSYWDTSAMCLCRSAIHRSSSSSRSTSFTRASPMPLVSYLEETGLGLARSPHGMTFAPIRQDFMYPRLASGSLNRYNGLELLVLLPPPLECWDYRCACPHPAVCLLWFLRITPVLSTAR